MLARDVQHAQVDQRVLVPGEADVANFASLLRFEHRLHGTAFGKDAVRVFEADHFMELHQVDVVGLEALEGLVDLLRGRSLGASVDLRHQEHLVAIAAGQRLAHTHFARAIVIVPTVIEEGNAAVDRPPDQLNGVLLRERRLADVVSAQTDGGHALAGAAEGAVDHPVCGGGLGAQHRTY